jgi:hypothetical protein
MIQLDVYWETFKTWWISIINIKNHNWNLIKLYLILAGSGPATGAAPAAGGAAPAAEAKKEEKKKEESEDEGSDDDMGFGLFD